MGAWGVAMLFTILKKVPASCTGYDPKVGFVPLGRRSELIVETRIVFSRAVRLSPLRPQHPFSQLTPLSWPHGSSFLSHPLVSLP